MDVEARKRRAALAALELVPEGSIVGVGTGSTTNHFIDALAHERGRVAGAVASSVATAARLRAHRIALVELDELASVPIYVDGADEATVRGELIKGGGGALTREKIVAAASERFVCIVDDSKLVERLGGVALPIEVLPMARGLVSREIARLGGRAVARSGFVTDNGHAILDLHGLDFDDPLALEESLDRIAGIVANGLFCRRPADLLLVGTPGGVRAIETR
jgi:ribose 5-phosphate isomerase A